MKHRLLLASIAAATLALTACGDKPQPAAPVSVAPGTSAGPNVAPAGGFSLDMASPSVHTIVGARTPDGLMSSTGKEGFLVYGPYLPVDPGKYRVRILGKWLGTAAKGTATADVTTGAGTRKLAEMTIPHPAKSQDPGLLVEFPLQLASREDGVELRVFVSQDAELAIQKCEISPVK